MRSSSLRYSWLAVPREGTSYWMWKEKEKKRKAKKERKRKKKKKSVNMLRSPYLKDEDANIVATLENKLAMD